MGQFSCRGETFHLHIHSIIYLPVNKYLAVMQIWEPWSKQQPEKWGKFLSLLNLWLTGESIIEQNVLYDLLRVYIYFCYEGCGGEGLMCEGQMAACGSGFSPYSTCSKIGLRWLLCTKYLHLQNVPATVRLVIWEQKYYQNWYFHFSYRKMEMRIV